MRKFTFDVEPRLNRSRIGRLFTVRAQTLAGAFRRARKLMRPEELVYLVSQVIRGEEQIVWHRFQ